MPLISVGTAPVAVFDRNSKRMTLTVRNESTAGQKIYFWLHGADGLTTTNADYVLAVGEEKNFILLFDGKDIREPVAAVADGALGTLYKAETAE